MSALLVTMTSFSVPKKNINSSHKWTYLYALYLGIDNGKLSMSMIKYSFDILLAGSDLASKAMQEWLHSPIGATVSTLSILSSISCSLIAHLADKGDEKSFRFIITLWPYARDAMKSLCNALRGVSSTLNLFYVLEIQDIRHLIIPIGIFVGILSVLNRIWIRYKSDRFHEMLEQNTQLLINLEELKTLSSEQIDSMRRKIIKQSNPFKTCSLLSSVLSGLIDGINPYIGTLALVTLSSPALLLISAFCNAYFFAIIALRIHDEIIIQRKFLITQKKVELHLLEKEITLLTHSLTQLSEDSIDFSSNTDLFFDKYKTLSIYLNHIRAELEKITRELAQITDETPTLLQGIKHGLNAYKSVMLTLSICIFISPVTLSFPPPQHRALLGMSSLGVGIIYSFCSSFLKQRPESTESYFKQNNTESAPPEIKTNSSHQNTNRFFSSPKQQQESIDPTLRASRISC